VRVMAMEELDERSPEDVAEELRVVLAVHGIKLPSLGVDPVSSGPGWYPYPLVALGNCNLATACRLLAVLASVPPPSGAELRRRSDELNAAVRRHLGEET
jgi:hypothetical protein